LSIKKEVEEYRKLNGNEQLTNKELLWYMISKFDVIERRITRTESNQKMMLWFVPVAIGITGIVVGLIQNGGI